MLFVSILDELAEGKNRWEKLGWGGVPKGKKSNEEEVGGRGMQMKMFSTRTKRRLKHSLTGVKKAVFFYRDVVCARMHGLGCSRVEMLSTHDETLFPHTH